MIHPPFMAVWGEVGSIGSAVSYKECEMLYNTALSLREVDLVEIGAWVGRTGAVLGFAGRCSRCPVFSIDHHNGDDMAGRLTGKNGEYVSTLPFFQANMEVLGLNNVTPVVMDSTEAHEKWIDRAQDIGLLFIDGLHTYEACKTDFINFWPHLADEARIFFHDYTLEGMGVKQVVNELVEDKTISLDSIVDSMACTTLLRPCIL